MSDKTTPQRTIDEIKSQILALFPVGSQWYDCQRDEIETVAFHFQPRGLVTVRRYTATHLPILPPDRQDATTLWDKFMGRRVLKTIDPAGELTKRDHVEIHRYSYSDLLDGLLIKPAADSEGAGELFESYHQRQKQINIDFDRMRQEMGFADAEMWGSPVLRLEERADAK